MNEMKLSLVDSKYNIFIKFIDFNLVYLSIKDFIIMKKHFVLSNKSKVELI